MSQVVLGETVGAARLGIQVHTFSAKLFILTVALSAHVAG